MQGSVVERDRVGMECVPGGRGASLPSHGHENDSGYQPLSLVTSQNWVRYSSRENSRFSAPAVI